MKTIIKNVIDRGNYNLGEMLNKINRYHIEGTLTDAERDELTASAREHANIRGGVDVYAKLEELDRRLAALESGQASGGVTEGIPEYVPGKWYYRGNKMVFGGKIYECSAPDGVVCTWSPDEYPLYWTVLE